MYISGPEGCRRGCSPSHTIAPVREVPCCSQAPSASREQHSPLLIRALQNRLALRRRNYPLHRLYLDPRVSVRIDSEPPSSVAGLLTSLKPLPRAIAHSW